MAVVEVVACQKSLNHGQSLTAGGTVALRLKSCTTVLTFCRKSMYYKVNSTTSHVLGRLLPLRLRIVVIEQSNLKPQTSHLDS